LQNAAEPEWHSAVSELLVTHLPIPKIRNAGLAALSQYCRFFA